MTGQGGAMAMQDALVLVEVLAPAGDLQSVLDAFLVIALIRRDNRNDRVFPALLGNRHSAGSPSYR